MMAADGGFAYGFALDVIGKTVAGCKDGGAGREFCTAKAQGQRADAATDSQQRPAERGEVKQQRWRKPLPFVVGEAWWGAVGCGRSWFNKPN